MQKITLYTLSLLFTTGAGLSLILIPMDEIYSAMWLSIFLIILACITRVVSKDVKNKGWDLMVLIGIIIPMFFVRLFPPMTIFFVSFDQTFIKVVAGVIIFISIILLINSQRNYIEQDRMKEIKNNLKLFVSALILTVLVFFGLNLYGNSLDLNKELNGNERIYLYSYGKYTPQVIETAFKDMEDGTDQVSQKMAIQYLSKMPNMSNEDNKKLEEIIFSKVIYGVAFESQLDLMIKLNPSRAVKVLGEVNKDSTYNSKLVAIDYLERISKRNPELKNEICIVGKDIYENAKKQVSDNKWDLESLELPSNAGRFKEICEIK